jgi:hypothetical protein
LGTEGVGGSARLQNFENNGRLVTRQLEKCLPSTYDDDEINGYWVIAHHRERSWWLCSTSGPHPDIGPFPSPRAAYVAALFTQPPQEN